MPAVGLAGGELERAAVGVGLGLLGGSARDLVIAVDGPLVRRDRCLDADLAVENWRSPLGVVEGVGEEANELS
jgi:hypothetical protein